jgi:hypothetical protein
LFKGIGENFLISLLLQVSESDGFLVSLNTCIKFLTSLV